LLLSGAAAAAPLSNKLRRLIVYAMKNSYVVGTG